MSTVFVGTFITVFLLFTASAAANIVRVVGAQQQLTAVANGVAKDVAQQGCLSSADLTSIDTTATTFGWTPSKVTLSVSQGTASSSGTGVGGYGQPVVATMTTAEPMNILGESTSWSWPITGVSAPQPSQYVEPMGEQSSLACTADSGMQATLGTPNAYVYGQNAFSGQSQGTYQTTSTPSGGTPTLTASVSTSTPTVGEAVTVTGTAADSGVAIGGTTVDVTPSGGGASSTQAVTGSDGAYSASVTFTSPGTYAIAVTDGSASASTSVTVSADSVSSIVVSTTSPVSDGATEIVYATVTDAMGNPVANGTTLKVSSTDSTDIPSQTVTTTGGEVALGVVWTQVGTWSVTFTSGSVSGSASVTVDVGQAANITLTASANPVQADPNPLTFVDGSPNMVQNPEFANGLSDWNQCCAGSGGVTVASDPSAPSGIAAYVTAPMNGVWHSLSGLVPGETYVLSAWLDAPAGMSINMELEWGGGNGAYNYNPSPGYTPSGTGGNVTGTGTWTQYDIWFTYVAGGDANFHIGAWFYTPSQNFEIADVQVVPALLVSGTVTDAEGNAVASGTSVTLTSPTDPGDFPAQTVVTDSSGEFWAVGNFTQAGTQTIEAAAGSATQSMSVAVDAAGSAQFAGVVVAPSPATAGSQMAVNGTLEDSDGNPVSGAAVTLSGGGATSQTATTAANGTFTAIVTPQTVGTDAFTLTSGSATWTGTDVVDAPSGTNDKVTGWVTSPGSMSGTTTAGTPVTVGATVDTSSGVAVTGATVNFTEPFSGVSDGSCTTTASGQCSISVTFTQAGSDYVSIGSGGGSGAVDITVDAAPAATMTLTSPQSGGSYSAGSAGSFTGYVYDAYGNPVGGSTVTLSGFASSATTTTTASDGSFAFAVTVTKAGSPDGVTASDGSASAQVSVTVTAGAAYEAVMNVVWDYPGTPAGNNYYFAYATGYVYDQYGNGISGVDVYASGSPGSGGWLVSGSGGAWPTPAYGTDAVSNVSFYTSPGQMYGYSVYFEVGTTYSQTGQCSATWGGDCTATAYW